MIVSIDERLHDVAHTHREQEEVEEQENLARRSARRETIIEAAGQR